MTYTLRLCRLDPHPSRGWIVYARPAGEARELSGHWLPAEVRAACGMGDRLYAPDDAPRRLGLERDHQASYFRETWRGVVTVGGVA
jgi:hypothetical protein